MEEEIKEVIKNKTVVITGGAGTIGSAVLETIMKYEPKKVIVLDFSEKGIFKIENKIQSEKCKAILCNINNTNKVEEIFKEFKPEIVIHTAAYKHVPIMEKNPIEAITNNILGTYNLIQISEKYKVKKFLLISTDKAVEPINIMGATKRICELLIKSKSNRKVTDFFAVRFGNVKESSGSLLEIVKEQIKNKEPITLTDSRMERYFMSIEEAVELILRTISISEKGKIYLLDMGEPVNIYNFIKNTLKEANMDLPIKNIGIRPGEKLTEKLYYDFEKIQHTKYKKVLKIEDESQEVSSIQEKVEKIKHIIEKEYDKKQEIYFIINSIIPTYKREE